MIDWSDLVALLLAAFLCLLAGDAHHADSEYKRATFWYVLGLALCVRIIALMIGVDHDGYTQTNL